MSTKIKFFLLPSVFIFYFSVAGFAFADILGQTTLFNVDPNYEYLSRKQIPATLRKISDKAYWYVSDDYWAGISEPEKDLFLTKLDELTKEFDIRIYPIETQFWGSEWKPGIDNDFRITIFIAKLIDQAGGYFDTSHEYKISQAPESNEREMIFLNTSGIINGRAKVFLAHEFQHLIAFYQKDILRNVTEDVWLNEARAEYAPRLLGYDDDFNNSNIRRRMFAFQQNPSDPLAEWKNESADYGAITLFMYYLVDNYGDKILVDSLKNSRSGVESLNETLRLNGFSQTFSDIFSDWTIANILNDSSAGPYAYRSEHLKNFRVSPTQSYNISGVGTAISLSNSVTDWQPLWYEFNTPIGNSLNLRIDWAGDINSKFMIPYISFYINGKKEIGLLPLSSQSGGTLFIKNFGSEIYKVVLIPANQSKLSDFTKSDPTVSFNLKTQFVSEIPEIIISPTPTPPPGSAGPQPQFVQSNIQNLLDQIRTLQEQISKLQAESRSSAFALNRNLFVGSKGNDVKWLQDFLVDQGVYPEARITGYFGTLTKNAAVRFQQKYGIFPQLGYVGVKTRAKIQELLK